MSFGLVLNICFMAVESLFEGVFSATYVGFSGVFVFVRLGGDSGLVYNCLL